MERLAMLFACWIAFSTGTETNNSVTSYVTSTSFRTHFVLSTSVPYESVAPTDSIQPSSFVPASSSQSEADNFTSTISEAVLPSSSTIVHPSDIPTTLTLMPTSTTSTPFSESSTFYPTTSTSANTSTSYLPSTSINASTSIIVSTSGISPSNSTSVLPHSSSVAPTPKPKPTPYPHHVTYKLEDAENQTCFMLEGSIEFSIVESGKKGKPVSVYLPANAVASGMCANSAENKSSAHVTLDFNSLTFTWTFEVEKDDSWKAINMTLEGSLQNNNETVSVDGYLSKKADVSRLSASKGHSYSCMNTDKVVLTNGITVALNKIQVQPFAVAKGQFSKADQCKSTYDKETSNIVPIAVGCALAGLIIIVLIAYLIGRRKTSSRGYQQV